MGWVIMSWKVIITEGFASNVGLWFAPHAVTGFLVCGDLLTIAAALIIYKDTQMKVTVNTEITNNGV